MPIGTPFQYAGSINTATGDFIGAGFDGLPIINIGVIDVDGYDRYYAMTAEEICSVYWNLAGVQTNLEVDVPILTYTDSEGEVFTNTDDFNASIDEILLTDNASGEGFDPSERMIAFPLGQFTESVGSEASGDPLEFNARVDATVYSVGSIRRMELAGEFIGYGMQICNLYVNLNNGSSSDREEFYKRVIISSWFENEVDDSSPNLDVTYSQVSVGTGLFWKEEQNYEKYATTDSYLTDSMITLSSFSPVFFDY